MNAWVRLGIFVAVLAGAVIYLKFIRDDRDDVEFHHAEQVNTIEAYQDYLRFDLNDHHRDEARARIGMLVREAEIRLVARMKHPESEMARGAVALLDAVAGSGDPRVAIDVRAPDLGPLAQQPREAGGLIIAPIAPSFEGGSTFSYKLVAAFNEVVDKELGDRVLRFASPDDVGPDRVELDGSLPTVSVTWKVRAGQKLYRSPNRKRGFLSVALDVHLTVSVPERGQVMEMNATVEPDPEFTFDTSALTAAMSMSQPDWDSQDRDVYNGMVKSAFARLALMWLHQITGEAAPEPVERSPLEVAREWCEKEHNEESCVELGFAYLAGRGVPVDKARAAELFDKGCLIGRAPAGCVPLARLRILGDGVEKNPIRGHMDLENGCRVWHAESCRLWAEIELRSSPEVADLVAAMPPAERPPRAALAAARLLKACDIGSPAACARVAGLYEKGQGVPRDAQVAAALYRRACGGGIATSCAAAERQARRGAKQPKTLFGFSLPKGAEVFDVRYHMHYEGRPGLTLWVAARQADALGAGGPGVVVQRYRPDATDRPSTAAAPEWARELAAVWTIEKGKRCEPCRPGGWGSTGSAFCDCPPH